MKIKDNEYLISGGYHIDRLAVFSDSMELAEYYHKAAEYSWNEIDEPDEWAERTRDHILGLWLFAKECVEKINELEEKVREGKIKNDRQQL